MPRVIGMRDEAGSILWRCGTVLQDVTRLRLLDEVKTNLGVHGQPRVEDAAHQQRAHGPAISCSRNASHGTLNAKQTELLLAAREDSERLLRMINDLLDLAKLESGRTALPSRPTEPRGRN